MSQAEYQQLMAVLRARRSVRRFTDQPVAREDIERALEAASWAPSASNRQEWLFLIVTSPDLKGAMAGAVREEWDALVARNQDTGCVEPVAAHTPGLANLTEAPVIIAVTARKPGALQTHLLGAAASVTVGSFTSAAMASQNLLLAFHALGLGACCLTGPLVAGRQLGRLLGLDERRELVCLIAVGHPAERPAAPARKPLTAIARFCE